MAQDDILRVVLENPAIIRKDIYEKMGVTWADTKQINSLLRKGFLISEVVNEKPRTRRFWITDEGAKHLNEAPQKGAK